MINYNKFMFEASRKGRKYVLNTSMALPKAWKITSIFLSHPLLHPNEIHTNQIVEALTQENVSLVAHASMKCVMIQSYSMF